MDRPRHRLDRRRRGRRRLWGSEASGHRHMGRPAIGRRLLRLWLLVLGLRGRLWRLGVHLRRLLVLRPRLLLIRRLGLRLARLGLLAKGRALLGLGHGRELTRKDRLRLAGCRHPALLRVKRKVELDAGLPATILHVLASIESSLKLLQQCVGDFKIAFVIRLVGGSLVRVHPKGSAIGAILRLLLLRLVGVHCRTGRG